MILDDTAFVEAVRQLRIRAANRASMLELLEYAKAQAGRGESIMACFLFRRAFDVPAGVAKSLGNWHGFEMEHGLSGVTADELEAEYGELIWNACARASE